MEPGYRGTDATPVRLRTKAKPDGVEGDEAQRKARKSMAQTERRLIKMEPERRGSPVEP